MKLYELKKGSVCKIDDKKYTFKGIDGMYGQWLDGNGEIVLYGTAGSTLEEIGIIIN